MPSVESMHIVGGARISATTAALSSSSPSFCGTQCCAVRLQVFRSFSLFSLQIVLLLFQTSHNYEQSRLTPAFAWINWFASNRVNGFDWRRSNTCWSNGRGARMRMRMRDSEKEQESERERASRVDELTKFPSCFTLVSIISSLFMHFLCNSAKYFSRWA